MDKVAGSGNNEFYTGDYAILPIQKYLDANPKFRKIWCPFDTAESNFVKMLSKNHEVLYSHIDMGMDFFKMNPPEGCNAIVSNPPYSCLTSEHEVLTKSGWKKISEINVGEDVLSVSFDKEISWDSVKRTIVKDVDEGIYHFESDLISQRVTKDHRMFACDFSGNLYLNKNNDLMTAKEIPPVSYHPTYYSTKNRKIVETLVDIFSNQNIVSVIYNKDTCNIQLNNHSMCYGYPTIENYQGKVYCLSLSENSVFLVKRNNKISFTGNCKTEVLERLFSLKIPFAMLVGVVGLFESQKRFTMFRDNPFEIMYLNKRVSYFKDYSDPKPSLNPPFSSVYICSGILPQQIVFEEINKESKKGS